jgi:hypothetical protein
MQINLKLTEDQEKAVVTSVLETLTPRQLASNLFSKIAISGEGFDSETGKELYNALAKYLKL